MTETSDQAATRRRWITLAELVAVAGVVIAGLTLWNGWSERRDQHVAEAAAQQQQSRLSVSGEVQHDGELILLKDAQHDIRDARFTFPSALGVQPQQPSGDPVIEARWIADAMLKQTDGGADGRAGRLPVLAELRYWDGDRERQATAIYDLVWQTEGRVLRGRSFRLTGLKLHRTGGTRATLDRLWKHP